MENEIQAGDVVELKSGGPPMTVGEIVELQDTRHAQCNWFDGKDQRSRAFPLHTLKKSEDGPCNVTSARNWLR